MDYNQLYADLVAAQSGPEIPPHAFTVQQFAEDAGLPVNTATNRLTALVKDGKLQTAKGPRDGRLQRFYWFVVP